MTELNPVQSLSNGLKCLLAGRIHFPRERIGQVITMNDGLSYTVFRQVYIDRKPGQPGIPGAQFVVRFHVANMSPRQNKLFSLLPIPFFVGLPGFRSKLWTFDEVTGEFQGIYEWDTIEDAENYANSFAIRFMTRRSVPGSISYQIISTKPSYGDEFGTPNGWRRPAI